MHDLFLQIAIGAILICLRVAMHAVATDRTMGWVERLGPFFFRKFRRMWKIPILMMTVLCLFASIVVAIWVWAILFYFAGAFASFEESLYFSTTSLTTLGYGDLVLGKDWRLLGSIEAANGMLLFGWSTAFIFEVVSKLYQEDRIDRTKP